MRTMIILALMATTALAEEVTTRSFYNDKGQYQGNAVTRGDRTTFSNEKGQVTGYGTTNRNGVTTFTDSAGRAIGTSRR
jgi:hypothetical protein